MRRYFAALRPLASVGYSALSMREIAKDAGVDRNGVKTWYAVWGTTGPWIAFAPIFQLAQTASPVSLSPPRR